MHGHRSGTYTQGILRPVTSVRLDQVPVDFCPTAADGAPQRPVETKQCLRTAGDLNRQGVEGLWCLAVLSGA